MICLIALQTWHNSRFSKQTTFSILLIKASIFVGMHLYFPPSIWTVSVFFYWPGLLINIEAQSCFSATAKKKKRNNWTLDNGAMDREAWLITWSWWSRDCRTRLIAKASVLDRPVPTSITRKKSVLFFSLILSLSLRLVCTN